MKDIDKWLIQWKMAITEPVALYKSQSKKGSFIESLVNIAIGITVGFITNITVLPAFGYEVSINNGILISLIFTGISLIRSYLIRRLFNKYNFFS